MAILFASLLLMWLPLKAEAQINNLSPTEQANVNLVIRNLQSLINDIQALGYGGSTQLGTSGLLSLDHLKDILTNLKNLNATKRILSVPGLEDGTAQYTEPGGKSSSVKAAYCPQGNHTTIQGQPCPADTIIVDPHSLDPNHGTPLNENNLNDWTSKWDLASTLVHEKQHEMYVKAALDELHGKAWWPTYPKKAQKENATITEALNAVNHGQVYQIQKDTLRALKDLLEKQKAKSNSDTAQALGEKIKKINGLLGNLTKTEKHLFAGGGLAKLESCGWPNDLHDGYLALIMTSPGVWERLDIQIKNGNIIDQTITQTEWDGEYDLFSSVTNNPSLFITASEQTLFNLAVLDDSCEYYKQLIQTGDIAISSSSPVDFRFVPDWFKNPALWLSDGQITDNEFANAIGFLMKKGIIFTDSKGVPVSEVLVDGNVEIPSWLKTDSNLWANNQISTDQFLQGIKYMLDNKIISFAPTTQLPVMQTWKVSIHVKDSQTSTPTYATVDITDLNGRTLQISTDQSGNVDAHLPAGTYTITINSDKYQQVVDKIQVNGDLDKTYLMALLQQTAVGQNNLQNGTHPTPQNPSSPPQNETNPSGTTQSTITSPSSSIPQNETKSTTQNETPTSTPNTPNPLQVLTNPTMLPFTHHIGKTLCPEFIGIVNLQSNQQGTWTVVSNPSWTSVAIQNSTAQIIFNCQLSQYVTQTLSGDVLFQFISNSNTTATASVSISGQINQG